MYSLFTELLGTFVFLAVILTAHAPIPVSLTLAGMVYFAGNTSGGHFNPAVSVMMWAKGDISGRACLSYIALQVLGGLLALLWFMHTQRKALRGK